MPDLQTAAAEAIARSMLRGALRYRRSDHLPRLLSQCTIDALPADEPARTDAIVQRLWARLEQEKRLLACGHWSGDFNTVLALRQAILAEEGL